MSVERVSPSLPLAGREHHVTPVLRADACAMRTARKSENYMEIGNAQHGKCYYNVSASTLFFVSNLCSLSSVTFYTNLTTEDFFFFSLSKRFYRLRRSAELSIVDGAIRELLAKFKLAAVAADKRVIKLFRTIFHVNKTALIAPNYNVTSSSAISR